MRPIAIAFVILIAVSNATILARQHTKVSKHAKEPKHTKVSKHTKGATHSIKPIHTKGSKPHRSALPSHSHGLGLQDDPPIPTNDPVPDPINWDPIFLSYEEPPVPRPGSPGGWHHISEPDTDSDSLPEAFDWRDHWGQNWITTVQNQGKCGSCWAFSITGLIEAQTHIQHGFWAKLSEADLFESSSRSCGAGWDFTPALDLIVGNDYGLADTSCNIYYDKDRPLLGCGDRAGRTLELGDYQGLETTHDEKKWLSQVGPITCAIDVYEDFFDWEAGDPPYRHTNMSQDLLGGHALLIVGYNDTSEAWIVKNSWGPDWGDGGFIEIGYGEVRIDDFQNNTKYGVTNLSPSQAQRRRHRNGIFFQSANGTTHRDLQVMRANPNGSLLWLEYSGDDPHTWSVISDLGSPVFDPVPPADSGNFFNASNGPITGQPILFASSFDRQEEAMYWVTEKGTFAHFYSSNVEDEWFQTPPGGTGDFAKMWHGDIVGHPGFIQDDDSNFTVVVKTMQNNAESLTEYFRNVEIGNFTVLRFVAESGILQSGPSLVQSNIGLNLTEKGSQGNMYVVAVTMSNQLQLFWRAANASAWTAGEVFGNNIPDTPPVMIQDFWDTQNETSIGGFQLLVANGDGNVEHWQRLNHDIVSSPPIGGNPGPWEKVHEFGNGEVTNVWGLLQGSFNFALEAIVEDKEGDLWHWRYTGEWKKGDKLPDQGDSSSDDDTTDDESEKGGEDDGKLESHREDEMESEGTSEEDTEWLMVKIREMVGSAIGSTE